MYCPDCGHQQSEAHRYCSHCGALLPVDAGGETTGPFAVPDADSDAGAAPPLRVAGPALAVRGGGPNGEVFPLAEGTLVIGRAPDSAIFLDDVTVSRTHAALSVQGGAVSLEDMGSMNGTYVNRRRIESRERLEDGDEIQVGKFRLAYIA